MHPGVLHSGGLPGPRSRNLPGPTGVTHMRSEVKSKIKNMGLQGSLLQAPAGGTGADLKATPSWGGRLSPPGLNGDAAGLPSGLVVRRYRRFVVYRVAGFDGVIELVAGLLFRVSRDSKGSVVYVNGRKIADLLGLGGTIHPIDLSVIYATMARLGFEVVEVGRGKAVVVSMKHPLIEKIKAAKSMDDVIQVIRKHLGE